jgi:hypothetical protein
LVLIKARISRHIKNIFDTGELQAEATVAKIATVQNEGDRQVKRNLEFYNLDMIISVGYRVNSIRGTHFRILATQQLKELIVKGFVLDNEKLKNPDNLFNTDYFDELLEQIADQLAVAKYDQFNASRIENQDQRTGDIDEALQRLK